MSVRKILAATFTLAAIGTAPVMITASAGTSQAGGVEQLGTNGAKAATGQIYYHAGGVEQLGVQAVRDGGESRCLVSEHHPHLGDCRFTRVYGDLSAFVSPPGRDDRVCGARASKRVTERDMVTGWATDHWFCSRHLGRAAEVKALLAARGEAPEPIPNTGGLLPRYFAADWVKVYSRHCEISLRHWTVPYHGVDADEWPVPGKTMVPRRPRLALVQPA